jgi:excisionase family DNA binding protein
MPTFLTVNEVAEILRRKPKTIRRWVADGMFGKVTKVKDGYLISDESLKKLIAQQQ